MIHGNTCALPLSPFPPHASSSFYWRTVRETFQVYLSFFPDVLPYVLIQMFDVPGALDQVQILHDFFLQITRRIRA